VIIPTGWRKASPLACGWLVLARIRGRKASGSSDGTDVKKKGLSAWLGRLLDAGEKKRERLELPASAEGRLITCARHARRLSVCGRKWGRAGLLVALRRERPGWSIKQSGGGGTTLRETEAKEREETDRVGEIKSGLTGDTSVSRGGVPTSFDRPSLGNQRGSR